MADILSGFGAQGFDMSEPRKAMSKQMTEQKKKKPWYTALISELGGAGGAGGGAAAGASIGSVVPGLGTAVGGLIGAAAGGFLGGTAGRVAENEVRDNRIGIGDAVKEGAINGVLSAGPGQLLKLAKGGTAAIEGGSKAFAKVAAGKAPEELLKTSTRGKLYDAGNQLIASQYGTLTSPVARATKPLDTISKLADYGITKPQDAERIAQAFTGAHGITNEAVTNAVGASNKVNLSSIEGAVDKALNAQGVVGSHAKSVKAFVMGQVARAEDANAVDPKLALDIMRNIEARTAEVMGKGSTYHLATTENALQSKALNDINTVVGDALYETAGANKNIASVLTPDFQKKLLGLHPNNPKWSQFVNDRVMKSQSVADLRSTMAPFVRVSKIIDAGDTNALTFGGRAGNAIGGGGSVGGRLFDFAARTAKGPASRVAGGALRAGSTAGIGAIEAPSLKGISARLVAGNADPSALLGGGSGIGAATAQAQTPDSLLSGPAAPEADATASLLGQTNDATAALLGQPQQEQLQGGPSLQSLQQAIQQDITSTGGKNIQNLLQLGQLYGIVDSSGSPVSGATGKPLTGQAFKDSENAKSGLASLQQLASTIQQGGVPKGTIIPGRSGAGGILGNALGTSAYDAAARNISDVIVRLRSGSAISDQEAALYNSQLPQAFDSKETIQRKLQMFNDLFTRIASQQNNGQSNDLLTQTNGGY
jgi:hypothetical protein